MLEKAAMEGLKIDIKMEELVTYLNKKIDESGDEIARLITHHTGVNSEGDVYFDYDKRFTAIEASRLHEKIQKCFEVIGIIDDIRSHVDKPVEELYDRIFRNVKVK